MPRLEQIYWTAYGLNPTPEHKFHPLRKWRFDWAFIDQKIAVEIEGGAWIGGRHTRGWGFLKDMEKYNAAGKLGWRIFRFIPQEFRKGIAQAFIKELL